MKNNETKINALVEKSKLEILQDIEIGVLPESVSSFSELHDYVDANCYGGFCEDDYEVSENYELENEVQNQVDAWLKNGRV